MFITYVGLWLAGVHVFEGTPRDLPGARDAAIGLALGVTILSVIVTALAALPAFLWMAKRSPPSRANVLFLGAALGNLPFATIVVVILIVQTANHTLSPDVARLWFGLYGAMRAIALGLLIGTSSAAVFWATATAGTHRDGSGA
jgi:type III secretory pathway component EscT